MPAAEAVSLGFLTTSIHIGVIGVFLLVVKTTMWNDETSTTSKVLILGVLYYVYAFMIAPQVDGTAHRMLGIPMEQEVVEEPATGTGIQGNLKAANH